MTELERFAAALLAQWRAEGGVDGGPIEVNALLSRVLPYRAARRILGIDVSEDYEALVLRLLSEEDQLVRTEPLEAAEMAKATIDAKLPDLEVLQLLRAATVTLTAQAVVRLDGVLPMRPPTDESRWASPGGETDKVLPLHAEPNIAVDLPVPPAPTQSAETGTPGATPPMPPAGQRCWSCTEALPSDRSVKFCPFCGADQRQPACAACGVAVERGWKHCPDCGAKLWGT